MKRPHENDGETKLTGLSALRKARKAMSKLGIPIARIAGRYPNYTYSAGWEVGRAGVGDKVVLTHYGHAPVPSLADVVAMMRGEGLPFSTSGVLRTAGF